MTLFISNTATAVLLAPYSHAVCTRDGSQSISISVGSSGFSQYVARFSISTPPNALVMTPG
jgi:di/tricarboxylate transporter